MPTPKRPPTLTAAIVLHALLGVFYLLLPLVALVGAAVGGTSVVVSEGVEEGFPGLILLGALGLGSMVAALFGAASLGVCYLAWRMNRAGIWALMIWSIVHVGAGCWVAVTVLTVVGGVQALDRTNGARA